MNNVKLTLNGTYNICTWNQQNHGKAVLFLLEQCVEHIFYEMNQYTHDVSKKFEYFVFLRQNCITNKSDANTMYKICYGINR